MRNLSQESQAKQIAKNKFTTKDTRQKPLAFRWWEPDCDPEVDTADGCDGQEPALVNGWAQPGTPLERFAFRNHADGSLEFKGHLNASAASSGTVAFTLPGANAGEVSFLPPNDLFFLTVIYDGATPQGAMISIDSTTGDVTITWPV